MTPIPYRSPPLPPRVFPFCRLCRKYIPAYTPYRYYPAEREFEHADQEDCAEYRKVQDDLSGQVGS